VVWSSFIRSQAVEGIKMGEELHVEERCDVQRICCFEIVCPGSKILVNHEDRRELIFLAVVETASGFDEPSFVLAVCDRDLGVWAAWDFKMKMKRFGPVDLKNEAALAVPFYWEWGEG
jgi:hypothetical protein